MSAHPGKNHKNFQFNENTFVILYIDGKPVHGYSHDENRENGRGEINKR